MNWVIPESRLMPQQRSFVDTGIQQSNICVIGFAKTGKTTCLFCKIKALKTRYPNQTILFLVLRNTEVELYKIVMRELGLLVEIITYFKFLNNPRSYDYIFCDDVQNITDSTLTTIKNHAGRVVVSMNPQLSIFEKDLITHEPTLTLNSVEKILTPRIFELHYDHGSFNSLVSQIFFSDNPPHFIFQERLVEPQVQICEANEKDSEINYIIAMAKQAIHCGKTVCVLLPTNKDILFLIRNIIKHEGKEPWEEKQTIWGTVDFNSLNHYLDSIGIPLQCIGNNSGDLSKLPKMINILTYYNTAGFVFDSVFMPFLNNKLFINSVEKISKRLFYLSLLTCRYLLFLTYCGSMHLYLRVLKSYCTKIDVNSINKDYL